MQTTKIVTVICFLAVFAAPVLALSSDGDALSAKVDEIVRAQIREQKLPGVGLAVIRDGKIVKATRYGVANVELNLPVKPQSLFHTESIAKTAPMWNTTADGVLYTNVPDMAKWDEALYTEKILKRSTLNQMWTLVNLSKGKPRTTASDGSSRR